MDSSNNFCDGVQMQGEFISSKQGLWRIVDSLNRFSTKRVFLYGAQYTLFATFALINYCIPYFMWLADLDGSHTTLLQLRSISSFLCFLLALKDLWPASYARYLPLYWHCTLMYCLPYTTVFLLLKSEGDTYWLLNMVLVMFLLTILTDWLSFILLLGIGSALSCLSYILFYGEIHLQVDDMAAGWCIYMYAFCLLIGLIFARNKSKIDEVRLGSFNILGATIAHEMRTPLLSLEMYAEAITRYIDSFQASLTEDLNKQELRASTLNTAHFLQKTVLNMRLMNRNLFHIIDMLLTKIKANRIKDFPLQRCSIKHCVQKAFDHYPLSPLQRAQVDISGVEDFYFRGNESLMQHVLFNLIKNALYFIKKAGKGSITVWTERQDAFWTALHFRDTGTGIAQDDVASVFKQFFTKSRYGNGIGLYFCKRVIEFFGGSILCQSVEGEFTEFIISLHSGENLKK